MANAGAQLHVPVLAYNGLATDGDLETLVLQSSAVAPVAVDTTNGVGEALQGEQVVGLVVEIVEGEAQAVVEQITLQTDIQLAGVLPLNLIVTDVGQLDAHGSSVVLHRSVAGADSIVGDSVIATNVVAGIQAQIVNACMLGEPILVGEHPSQLETGEQSPLHAEEAQTISIIAETAVGLGSQRERGEIAVHIVIIYIAIPHDGLPHVVDTIDVGESGRGQRGVLIVSNTLILGTQVTVVEREIVVATSYEGIQLVLA